MKVTYYGQSCLGVEVGGKTLLFDPFIRDNALARAVDFKSIRADYILLTHGHFDHVADAPDLAKQTGAQVISTPEVCTWVKKQGVENVETMVLGGRLDLGFCKVKSVPAVHSSQLPDGSNGGLPGGFVITSDEGSFYHSGDTALTMEMQLIGMFTKLNWAALCLGDHFTMGIEDAIRAAEFIQCDRILGIHYDTFPPLKIDHADAIKRFAAAGKELTLMPIGTSQDF